MSRKKRRGKRSPQRRPPPRPGVLEGLVERWRAPQPILRLETLRILLPLCILAFMSSRLVHADHWIGDAGFTVPDLGGIWRQPLYLPPLPDWGAWTVAGLMVASGLSVAAGLYTRPAAALFAATLLWVALADRLAAFTVTKMAPVLALALCVSPAGARHGVDAWRRRRGEPDTSPFTHVPAFSVRFFQLALVVLYFSSGICKARGDWLDTPYLLWTHLHDSYETAATYFLANTLPAWSWNVFQATTLAFEALAPLWFGLSRLRPFALAYGLGMHAMIGLTFGPVVWFALLMASLLVGCFAPLRWLEVTVGRLP